MHSGKLNILNIINMNYASVVWPGWQFNQANNILTTGMVLTQYTYTNDFCLACNKIEMLQKAQLYFLLTMSPSIKF